MSTPLGKNTGPQRTNKHSIPGTPGMPTGAGWLVTGRDETAYAWAIALLPLVAVMSAFVLPNALGSWWVVAALWVLSVVLGNLDSSRTQTDEIWFAPSAVAVLLLPPVYLIQRTRHLGSTAAIPLVWFAATVCYVLIPQSEAAEFSEYNARDMESRITGYYSARSTDAVEVSCPDDVSSLAVGDTFTCEVSNSTHGPDVATVKVYDDGSMGLVPGQWTY